MKNKSINFIVPLHIYPFDVMFSVGENNQNLFAKLHEKLPKEYHGSIVEYCVFKTGGIGRYVMFPNGASLIRLKRFPQSPEDKGALQHEIFHCVEHLMDRIGVKHDLDSSETWAYLIGYLTTEFYKKCKA